MFGVFLLGVSRVVILFVGIEGGQGTNLGSEIPQRDIFECKRFLARKEVQKNTRHELRVRL